MNAYTYPYMDGVEVEKVESVKFLGMNNTSSLSWTSHIEVMVKKAHQLL